MLRPIRAALLLALLASAAQAQKRFLECTDVIHTVLGEATGDQFGWVSADMPDITGDGTRELIVSAPFNDGGGTNAGRVYVYDPVGGTELFRATGSIAGEVLGTSVASAGDVDGDGVCDFIAGSPGAGMVAGLARVYSGVDGSLLRTIQPGSVGDRAGSIVAGVGDVDGDGFDDVALSAPNDGTVGTNAGKVYVISGRDGVTELWSIFGEFGADRFGAGMGSLGDVTGDGKAELAIGAQNAGPGSRGRCYVYDLQAKTLLYQNEPDALGVNYGQYFVYAVGDLNNDGWPDLYVSDFSHSAGRGRAYFYDGPSGALLFKISGKPSAGFGIGRGVGDVNGDGHDDVLMASWTDSTGAPTAGQGQVFSGADGALLRTITSTRAGEGLGFDAHGIGDVDGDGRPDHVLTAANRGGSRGALYIVAGGAPVVSFGQGLAGTGAVEPTLGLTGCPELGTTMGVAVAGVRGAAPGWLVIGTELPPTPFRGGTIYAAPSGSGSLVFAHLASGAPAAAGVGAASFSWLLPTDAILAGMSFVAQAAYLDPDAPRGFSLTAAIRLELF